MSYLSTVIARAVRVVMGRDGAAIFVLWLAAGAACAAEATALRVNVFPGAANLALFAGIDKGVFERRGLKVEVQFTPNSDQQRKGLAEGAFEIAHAAVDNAVHMVEDARQDVIIVMGGDSSMNEFLVQPEIRSIAELRGRIIAVDAPNTAYALLAKKILLKNGMREGRDYTVAPVGGAAGRMKAVVSDKQYAAVVLNVPWSILAMQNGLKSLGRTVDLLGPYQASGAFVMRSWASANGPLLERYMAAYLEALRWVTDPANRSEGVALLVQRLKLAPEVAGQTYDLLREPGFGLAPDARFDMEGFRNMLALRAEIEGQWGGRPPAPEKYIDLSYYERAMKALAR
ncbi:MAG TPA: ABC transporter substrate-binding protein [Burkholderiales bacterium]|nr:ABC transporter substrate-binding protein [Burkholderiales bacterium]